MWHRPSLRENVFWGIGILKNDSRNFHRFSIQTLIREPRRTSRIDVLGGAPVEFRGNDVA